MLLAPVSGANATFLTKINLIHPFTYFTLHLFRDVIFLATCNEGVDMYLLGWWVVFLFIFIFFYSYSLFKSSPQIMNKQACVAGKERKAVFKIKVNTAY